MMRSSPHLDDPSALERLEIVALDLTRDEGWDEALKGCGALMHTASPFPLNQPKDPEETIRPAVDGTLRALKAAVAAGIERVVLTSIDRFDCLWARRCGDASLDRSGLTNPDAPGLTPYAISKTLAEKAAWEFAKEHDLKLTAVNPSFVIGAPLDTNYGTSIEVVERLLAAKDPMLPEIGFASVDVGDIADIHVRALQKDETIGLRIIGAGPDFLWFSDLAQRSKLPCPTGAL